MSDTLQPQVAAEGPSAGAMLRQAREAAGLHVAALAVSMKVPVRKLEALEEDRFDLLPDAVFARALASSMCRTLKVDPQPVLDRLPQSKAPRLIQDREGLNEPFRPPTEVGGGPSWFEHLTKPVFLSVFALLLGALVLLLMPAVQKTDSAATTADTLSTPVPAVTEPSTAVLPTAMPHAAVVPASMQLSATAPAASPLVPGPSAPARAEAPPVAAAAGVVAFRASGASWVEVTDARGNVTLRRLLAAGESASASGTLPLSVTVGSVNATQVLVRGKPFSMAAVSRDNVARFEVK